MSDDDHGEVIQGVVKWFDPVRGFGFVVAGEEEIDILLHANVLRNFGQSSVLEEANIELIVQTTPRGKQAVKVLSIEPPTTLEPPELEDLREYDAEKTAALPLLAARIKWFDRVKGFGFANVFGNKNDVFIHIEVLMRSGLADLQTGEAVALRVIDGKRGQMAISVLSWETANKP